MEELKETIHTYDRDVKRWLKKLEFDRPDSELEIFTGMLEGKMVFDAGCGAGRDLIYFVEHGYEVIGMDMSIGMLKAARERVEGVQLIAGDIRKTKFGDETFDGVWCYNTLLHLDGQGLEEALGEFYRVLKPRGILYIATREGEGIESKESKAGTKHFYLYDKMYLGEQIKSNNFEIVLSQHYKRKDQEFVDIAAKKIEK